MATTRGARRAARTVATAALVAALAGCSPGGGAPPDDSGPSAAAPSTPCGTEPVTLAVATEVYGAVSRVLTDAGCTTVSVVRTTAADVSDPPGDLWIADYRWTAGMDEVLPAVVTSPLVVVSRAHACGRTWRQVVASPRYRLGDPASDTAALESLVLASAGGPLAPLAEPILERQRRDPADEDRIMVERVEDVASREFGPGGCTLVTEQAALQDGRAAVVTVPAPATTLLRYPLVAPGPRPASADLVAAALTSRRASRTLAGSLLRGPGGDPVRGGVGAVRTTAEPGPDELERVLGSWEAVVSATG